MRRILIRTATLGVGCGLVFIALPLLGVELWLQDGGTFEAFGAAVDLSRPGMDAAALGVVVLVGSAIALAVTWWVASRTAARVAWLLGDLGERAEQMGGGDPRPVPLSSGIGEVDRLDAALARGARQSATRLATERDFAADASHQLRTPLTALLMRLEEIAVSDNREVVEEEALIAIAQVERLSLVVDDLMSRTRSGVHASPSVSLDSVLAGLQREWQQAFATARRSINVSGERGLRVRATPVALGQILTTLLENSLTHGRGTVEISARRAGPSVVIEVSDQGDGVSKAMAPHIFERSVSSGGSGLGLTLARDLAEAAGGRLELVSAQPPIFALFISASTD